MSIKLYGEFAKHLKSNGGRPAALFDKLDATNQAILKTLALHCWAAAWAAAVQGEAA